MPDPPRGPDGPVGPVVQEVQVPVLGDVVPPVAVGRSPGGVVRQGVQRPAVDHAVRVPALRADLQAVHRPVRLRRFQPDEIVVRKGIGPQPQGLQPELLHVLHKKTS